MKDSFFFNVINNYFSHRKDIKRMTRLTIVGLKVTINSQRNLTASSTCTILNIDKSSPNFFTRQYIVLGIDPHTYKYYMFQFLKYARHLTAKC